MKKFLVVFSTLLLFWACGSEGDGASDKGEMDNPEKTETKADEPDLGIGEFTKVDLNNPLDTEMIARGQAIYEMKCSACHKVNDQRVVGPGFKGVTNRRTPEWVMNMITNVEVMLAENEEAQELLKECLVRMPNQNLSGDDARDVLEWLYNNDTSE